MYAPVMSVFLWISGPFKVHYDIFVVWREVLKIESYNTFGDLLNKVAGKEVEQQKLMLIKFLHTWQAPPKWNESWIDSWQRLASQFLKYHNSCSWYIELYHQQVATRGILLPKEVGALHGHNDWCKMKMKETRLSSSKLDSHIQRLSQTLNKESNYRELLYLTEGVSDALHK